MCAKPGQQTGTPPRIDFPAASLASLDSHTTGKRFDCSATKLIKRRPADTAPRALVPLLISATISR